MNAARVIHGIAAFMLLGMAYVLLGEFGVAYKHGHIGEAFRQYEKSLHESGLPWLSALVLPLAPIAWWSALTPLFLAIGIAARVPAESPSETAMHWLCLVSLVDLIVLGAFFAYVKVTAVMGYPLIPPPTPAEIAVNAGLLVASGCWMARGIRRAGRPPG
jgi:hypothetical protein